MQSSGYDIAEHRDHLEIRGVSRDELAEALELVEPIRNLRAEHVEAVRGDLLQVFMSRYVFRRPRLLRCSNWRPTALRSSRHLFSRMKR